MSFQGRKVRYAKLREDVFVPYGVGNVKSTLEVGGPGSKVSTMTVEGEWLYVKLDSKGFNAEFGIPLTEVKLFYFDRDIATPIIKTETKTKSA